MRRGRGAAGAGLLGSMAGLLVFLTLLLFATHLLVGLHATTVVTDAAADAAAMAAAAPIDHRDRSAVARTCVAAEQRVRQLVGRAAAGGRVECSASADEVVVRVRVPRPAILLRGFDALPGGGSEIDRTARARIEVLR